jgi:hypothetical protein
MQRDDSDSLIAETALRSIIRQSIETTGWSARVKNDLKKLSKKPFIDFQDWVFLLQQQIQQSDTFYLIDGLDEADPYERRLLLKALHSLLISPPKLRVLITSRDSVIIDVRNMFPALERIRLTPEVLDSDIRRYIETTLTERITSKSLWVNDSSLFETIRQTLSQHADGM